LGGNDILSGGYGYNTFTGGAGNDTFKFTSLAEKNSGPSSGFITDFTPGDKIDLTGADANINLAGDQAFTFVGANAFTGVAGELRYQSGELYGDINGDSNSDFTVYVYPTGSSALTATDFIL
jgi:serralysin